MTTRERHGRIGELFLAVCDLSGDDQTTTLDRLCGEEPELRSEVKALLEQDSRANDSATSRLSQARASNPTQLRSLSARAKAGPERTRYPVHTATGDSTGHHRPPAIPGYEIIDMLGYGGMGIVYRARQIQLKRDVALKVLPAMFTTASPSVVERFKREAAAAARLRHPNIVPVYDFGRCDD